MSEGNVLEISISGTRNAKNKYAEYEVVCITNKKGFGKCYITAFRRYSDFYKLKLCNKLKCFIKVLSDFPRNKWKKLNKEVLEERMLMFMVYLRFVCDYVLKDEKDRNKVSADVVNFMQDSDLKIF